MGCHPRIETNEHSDFITSRTRDSRLWFVNNEALDNRILGLTAKYATRRTITLYGCALEGNHLHIVAHNNKKNRAHFFRDLKSTIARAVPRYTPSFSGGTVWGRRYSNEFLGDSADIENYFFYTVLQPVKDGLVEKISDYPGYKCFHDAVWGDKENLQDNELDRLLQSDSGGGRRSTRKTIATRPLRHGGSRASENRSLGRNRSSPLSTS